MMTKEQWNGIHNFLSKWVVPAGAVAALLGLVFGGVRYIIRAEVSDLRNDVSSLKENVKSLTSDLASKNQATNERIDGLLKDALERAFPRSTANKADVKGSFQHVDDALQIAKAKNVKLDPELLARYGKQVATFSDEPAVSADARKTLTNLLDYRSFLNADFIPSFSQLTPATGESKYRMSVSVLPNPDHPDWALALKVSYAGGYATGDKSARLEFLNNPQPEGSEFAFVIIDGGMDALVLDGMFMKNVIIRNSVVVYSGGPAVLQNVYFVNCTFKKDFPLTPAGLDLGIKLLSAASVNFDSRNGAAENLQLHGDHVHLSPRLRSSLFEVRLVS
ncbi:MAG TPA: hypothetical protein VN976_10235 [Verrucomicrobiae bacterium]|nr:hypothetical protein [Verrucomicrobiae bacterium]